MNKPATFSAPAETLKGSATIVETHAPEIASVMLDFLDRLPR